MTKMARKALSGPRRLYRHVTNSPVTMKMTPQGIGIMDAAVKRKGFKSRGEYVEHLVRIHDKDKTDPAELEDARERAAAQ